jgi:hypothetical protein
MSSTSSTKSTFFAKSLAITTDRVEPDYEEKQRWLAFQWVAMFVGWVHKLFWFATFIA